MSKITISDITAAFASTTAINAKFQQIEDELNNKVLYRTNPIGEPNSMSNDLDMAGYNILNASTLDIVDVVGWATEWANKAEDSLISTDAGGDGVDDYSALHHAAKAAADVVLTNADVVLTNADVVNTAADVVAVAAIYEDFDARYLGAKASDPVLDNQGVALTDGALYYNNVLLLMKVYDLGTTAWIIFTPNDIELLTSTLDLNIAVDVDYTLSTVENDYGRLFLSDTGVVLTGPINLVVADAQRTLTVANGTAQTITVKRATGTGTPVASGQTQELVVGTNSVVATDSLRVELGTILKTKVIDIGDWDMDATVTVNVAHGLTASKIRSCDVLIIADSTGIYPFVSGYTTGNTIEGAFFIDNTFVSMERKTGGVFDNTSFDQTSFNRGWITIQYVGP